MNPSNRQPTLKKGGGSPPLIQGRSFRYFCLHDSLHDDLHDSLHDDLHDSLHDDLHDSLHDDSHDGLHDDSHDGLHEVQSYPKLSPCLRGTSAAEGVRK